MRQKLKVTWNTTNNDEKLRKFRRYLKDKGTRQSTIEDYVLRAGRYLTFCGSEEPSPKLAQSYRDHLLDKDLSNSSVANYSYAVKSFHKMLGQDIKFPFLKRNNAIPGFLTASEVSELFNQIHNIKHLAMFKTAFYACLRASELCDLDVEDIDLEKLTLIVRNGKGGKTAVCYLQEEAVETLREYLAVRPDVEVDGHRLLFFSDFGAKLDRRDIHRLVVWYKKKAGIRKPGGAHVLFRHTPASLMVQNGCDLLTIQQVMRHNDIQTTMRYLHLADEERRAKYDKFLRL